MSINVQISKAIDALVRMAENIKLNEKRSCSRPMTTWKEKIRNDMRELYHFKDLSRDKTS